MLAADGTPSAPADVLATPTQAVNERLLVTPDGTEVVLFADGAVTRATVRPPGGTFSPPVALTPADVSGVSAALTPTGDVITSWVRPVGVGEVGVALGGLDSGTPPVLIDVAAPALTPVGRPVRFAAATTDPMGVASVAWDFGDGGSAASGDVDHTFATAGTFTATVTAIDRAGNRFEASRTVRVLAPGDSPDGTAGSGGGGGGAGGAGGGGAGGPVADVAPTVAIRLPKPPALRRPAPARAGGGRDAERARGIARRPLGPGSHGVAAGGAGGPAATATAKPGGPGPTLRLRPKVKPLGRPRAPTLSLAVTAVDATGHLATVRRSVRVRR